MHTTHLPQRLSLLVSLLCISGACLAQYKVVGPDGKVTYTDRPAANTTNSQVLTVRPGLPVVSTGGVQWPVELREPIARFPVSLYTGADCAPCDSARKLLQQRGVPFAEHTVATQDDINTLQRLTGGRTLPSALVGNQALRGLQETDWHNTLDLAGYPKEPRLPRNYQAPAPTPLAGKSAADASAAVPSAPPQVPRSEPVAPQPDSRGIRF